MNDPVTEGFGLDLPIIRVIVVVAVSALVTLVTLAILARVFA